MEYQLKNEFESLKFKNKESCSSFYKGTHPHFCGAASGVILGD